MGALATRVARLAERTLPAITVAYVLAAVAARVLAIGDVWSGYTVVDAMVLYDLGWWVDQLGRACAVIGNPWAYFGLVLAVTSLAVREPQFPKPAAWRVTSLRAAVLCALACVVCEPTGGVRFNSVPILLGGVALLLATRRGNLPSWQVALGAWVLTSRMGLTTRVFAQWHEYHLPSCMTPPPTLAELAPACVAFQLSSGLALWTGRGSRHAGLRRLAAVWALFSALDTATEVAVGHALTQREPWTAWMTTWSFVAQAVACCAALTLATLAYRSLRAALHEDLDPQLGGRAAIAAVFGFAMLAPVLTRHPLPWDVNNVGFDSLGDVPDVTSLRAAPDLHPRLNGARTILIASPSGLLDAETGRNVRELQEVEYGVIMDQRATVSDFTHVARRLLYAGVFHVYWALPAAVDQEAVGAIPARYAVRGFAQRQLVYANVSAFVASPHAWNGSESLADPTLHLISEALEDHTPLRAYADASVDGGYRILVNLDDLYLPRPPRWPPRVTLNPLRRVFRDSAHTMAARLFPFLAGVVLGYAAFLLSVQRDLARLRREQHSGQWLRSSEPLSIDPGVPCFPPWITPDDAQLVRVDGSPYRGATVARAATMRSAREHVRLRMQGMHHVGVVYVGVTLAFLVVVTIVAIA